ncbi:SLAC1 anion channel family protein [Variovorax sp. J22P240]|uniref:SLAC1 anion channel family protein n=1 Tax=Variovorax sp. J22P240 TaxID=3053514 RepID=UPI0025788BBD|nr:SLAC1 anion channel family protein [Variovorax sp. J22P240]MDL9997522.1 SLAC1 anion channel family protein [Variovorax sp. J22P240]
MNEPLETNNAGNMAGLAYLPVSLFGSVMGLCGLALAWRLAAIEFGLPRWVGEVLGYAAAVVFVALVLAYAIKFLKSPNAVRTEFAHPVAANFFATPIISLLLLPAVVAPYALALAKVLWVAGTMAMLGFAWLIVSRWMSVRQQIAHATPAWIVPVVGTLNISIAGVPLNLPGSHAVCVFALAVGLFFAVPLFTLILSRVIFEEPMPQPLQPSLMILVAPFAVGFSAYLNVAGQLDLFAELLFYLAVFMLAVLLPKLVRLRSCSPFHTSWWAVSFPLAAMTLAALKFSIEQPSWLAQAFALAMLAFTTLVILSLGFRTSMGMAQGELRALTL